MTAKCKDKKNRWRSKTVSFRVSPEEWAQFETAVKLSGLSKQDYLIHRMEQRDIIVTGNPRLYKALREELAKVLDQLQAIQISEEESLHAELLETIRLITITLHGLQNGQNESPYPAR